MTEHTFTASEWKELVAKQLVGKKVADAVYVHVSAVDPAVQEVVDSVRGRFGRIAADFTVVKLRRDAPKLSLLTYPGFLDDAFPTLAKSCSFDFETAGKKVRDYPEDTNRPILHRKELFVAEDHPKRPEFCQLTAEAERLGLFEDTRRIGYAWHWDELLRARGLDTDGNRFVPRKRGGPPEVVRHRTAMARNRLSAPMQALWRHGFLDGTKTVFDYGCGRGDDLAALQAAGIPASGWDPYFRPESELTKADVVNIGFVINVIEDKKERRLALTRAWKLADRVMSVAAMIGGRSVYERFRLLGDGVVTSRDTFQKYYAHPELGEYITEVTGREPVSIAPGVYFVFTTDEDEQEFLEQRQRSRRRPSPLPRVPVSARKKIGAKSRKLDRWIEHQELLEEYWRACLQLARPPSEEEFARHAELREKLGTPKRVVNHLLETRGTTALEEAQEARRGDLLVFQALNLFQKRRSFGSLKPRLQKDIKTLFGSHQRSIEEAKGILFSIADAGVINDACEEAAAEGLGHLIEGESLQLASDLVSQLPPILRIYVGCAEKLYGEVEAADLVKIHIGSGKLTVLLHEDFEAPIPMLIERVKIDMARQRVNYYEYGGEYEPQPLYLKSRYLRADSEGYARQKAFDDLLVGTELFSFEEFGPPIEYFRQGLAAADLSVDSLWERAGDSTSA